MATFERGEGQFSLQDQEFLKELGISAMPSGLEFMLRQHEEMKEAKARIEKNAEKLQNLSLSPDVLAALAKEKGVSVDEIRNHVQFFRDVEDME